MLCPSCGHDNLPGADHCGQCQTSLTQEDVPVGLIQSRIEESLSRDRIETLNPGAAVSVAEDTSLDVVVAQMRQRKIGCVLITDREGRLSGIFTERDLINKVVGSVEDLTAEPVSRFMSQRPETGQADQLLASALQRMKVGDFRYLPLVDDGGRPMKIISSRDIINHLTSLVMEIS